MCLYLFLCQAFRPVAECAKQVLRDNGYDACVKLIAKRSTELTVGPCTAAVICLVVIVAIMMLVVVLMLSLSS